MLTKEVSLLNGFQYRIFLKVLFIYLAEIKREHKQGEQQREKETGSQWRREPNMGLDPRTLGS